MADGQGNIQTISTRERFKYENTLVCLLQALAGRRTTVELRNETAIEGKIVHVDGFMNTEMSAVTVIDRFGRRQAFDRFHIHGKRIRFVHIPNDVNIGKAIESQMSALRRRRNHVDKQAKIGTMKNLKAEEKMKARMRRGDETPKEGKSGSPAPILERDAGPGPSTSSYPIDNLRPNSKRDVGSSSSTSASRRDDATSRDAGTLPPSRHEDPPSASTSSTSRLVDKPSSSHDVKAAGSSSRGSKTDPSSSKSSHHYSKPSLRDDRTDKKTTATSSSSDPRTARKKDDR